MPQNNPVVSLAYYILQMKNGGPGRPAVSALDCLAHDNDYQTFLQPYEEFIRWMAAANERECLPLQEIHLSAEIYRDIVDQVYQGINIDNIGVPYPPPPEPPVVADEENNCFSRYINILSEADHATSNSVNEINDRIESILAERTAGQQRLSGLVVGRVQSGKTRNYVGLMLKAVSQGWNVIFVLTSNSTALGIQTYSRIKKDFAKSSVDNGITLNTVNENPVALRVCKTGQDAANIAHGFFWGVALKEPSHLDNIINWLHTNEPYVPNMRILIIDDEADTGSTEANAPQNLWNENKVNEKLEAIREESANIADWFNQLFTIDIDEDQQAVIDGNIQNGTARQKQERLLAHAESREILNLNNFTNTDGEYVDIVTELNEFFNKGRGGDNDIHTHGCFLRLFKSVMVLGSTRSVINSKIRQLIDRTENAADYEFAFARCAYIGYTATPYACLFNRRPDETPLYPDFVYSLPKSSKYFGLEEIFGSDTNTPRPRMNIVTTLGAEDIIVQNIRIAECSDNLDNVDEECEGIYIDPRTLEFKCIVPDDNGGLEVTSGVWETLKNACAWAMCTAAARRRYRNTVTPEDGSRDACWTTMMVNLAPYQDVHENLKKILTRYFNFCCSEDQRDEFIDECAAVWNTQTRKFTRENFAELLGYNPTTYPEWEEIEADLDWFLNAHRQVIILNSTEDGKAGQIAYEDGGETPNAQAARNDKLWIICGGNTISRGLTLSGLTVSYFDRVGKGTAVDTFTQMGRWFGYRPGYELLPRIWMPALTVKEYKNAAFTEKCMHEKLRQSFADKILPSDGENFLTIYFWGRKLSGRAFVMKTLTSKIETAFSTNAISYTQNDVDGAASCINTFLSEHERWDNSEAYYPQFPVWRNISSADMKSFLSNLQNFYPDASKRTLRGIMHEIDRADIAPNWDVVLGCAAEDHETDEAKYNIAENIWTAAGTPNGNPDSIHEVAEYSSARAVTAFYAMIDRNIVNAVDAALLNQCQAAVLSNINERIKASPNNVLPPAIDNALPAGAAVKSRLQNYIQYLTDNPDVSMDSSIHGLLRGNSALDGYRNRSSRDYQLKVYEAAGQIRPVLQIYPILSPNGDQVVFSISLFWPNHVPDQFLQGALGLPETVKVSENEFCAKVREILENHNFLMPRRRLLTTVIGAFEGRCDEQTFTLLIGANKGFSRFQGKVAYYAHSWAADNNTALAYFTEAAREVALSALIGSGERLSRKEIIEQILNNDYRFKNLLSSTDADDLKFIRDEVLTAEFCEQMGITITSPNYQPHYQYTANQEDN